MSVLLCGIVVLTIAFGLLIRKLRSQSGREWEPEWIDGFSLDTYQPMQRLLNEADYTFLASQPGYRPEIAKQLRAERKAIFRGYLRQLTSDFNKLAGVADFIMVHAPQDRPDLARSIWMLRFNFYCAVLETEFFLAFGPLPLTKTSAGRLLGSLTSLMESVQQMLPAHESM